jgi:hypothetical protein
MNIFEEIKIKFTEILSLSLNSNQIHYLGQKIDSNFDLYSESGFGRTIPIPRQIAAQTIINYFKQEKDIVQLYAEMLQLKDTCFHGSTINIIDNYNLIKLIEKNKWVYNNDQMNFYPDPFYEREINFLKSVRLIDLRTNFSTVKIIREIKAASEKLKLKDLEWRITVRLYEIDREKEKLIREVVELLLARQNLGNLASEIYICLKELIINSSKANYKILFEKYVTRPMGITSDKNYIKFLKLFKEEIETNGQERLSGFAQKDDMFFNVFFQSTNNSIAIWVSNYSVISKIEKMRILKKFKESDSNNGMELTEDDYSEGAGMGISLVLKILKQYSGDKDPLKVIFYPEFIKIGFELLRSELLEKNDNQTSPGTTS